jgi:uncharacterized membrane protein YGL010W
MKTLTEQLSGYATCHRDRLNIATHYVGIPLILLAVTALLSRPAIPVEGWPLSPAVPIAAGIVLYYLVLDLRFGLAMALVMAASLAAGAWAAALSKPLWLGLSLGSLAVGFIAQLVGHRFEGRKPAFVDDLMGFLIGPLFLVAEAAFALGLRQRLQRDIETFAGPTRSHRRGLPGLRGSALRQG